MKIAFHNMGNEQWVAGLTTLDMLFHALPVLGSNAPRLALTAWDNQPEESVNSWQDRIDEIIRLPSHPSSDFSMTALLKEHGIDLFFSLPIQTALSVHLPRIIWIYDFQHRHFPEFFTPADIERMERLFAENARTANRILVTSRAVAEDAQAILSDARDKVCVLPFVPVIPSDLYERNPEESLRIHNLPKKFFLLPNQFLPHKNHSIVLRALSILKDRGCPVVVVCTGQQGGPQKEACFKQIMDERATRGLESQFLTLGLIPRPQVFDLIRQSVAVLNPALFEGFGYSVAEALHTGKRVLASDLPVLHEHAHPAADYFDPNDADRLADKMARVWEEETGGPSLKLEADARRRYSIAVWQFASRFMRIVSDCVGEGVARPPS